MNARVLLVIPQLDVGGAEVQLVRLAARLRAHGFEPEVAVFYEGGALEPELRAHDVPVHHLERTTKLGHEAILDLARLLRTRRFCVVHAFLRPANWRARVAALLAPVPAVFASVRSVEVDLGRIHATLDRILAVWTDAVVVNAEAIGDFLVRRERLSPRLFRVIRNGLDLDPFNDLPPQEAAKRALGIDPGAPFVVCVGNLQPEKNHEDFLALAREVSRHRPDATFALVGDGERRGALEIERGRLGLDARVRFAGFQSDVRPFLAACDVFLNTSRREGCCNAILEAMAARRPVVAYAVGGNPDVVADGVTGVLAPFGSIDRLSEAVERYLGDPELRRAHGDAGRDRVRRVFGVAAMVERTAALYREVLVRKMPS